MEPKKMRKKTTNFYIFVDIIFCWSYWKNLVQKSTTIPLHRIVRITSEQNIWRPKRKRTYYHNDANVDYSDGSSSNGRRKRK